MLEQFAPLPILVGSLLYAGYLFGTKVGRSQAGMHRAASLTLVLSGYSGSRCMGKEREGLLTPASLAQSDRASQARRWRCEANDSIYDTHLLQTQV